MKGEPCGPGSKATQRGFLPRPKAISDPAFGQGRSAETAGIRATRFLASRPGQSGYVRPRPEVPDPPGSAPIQANRTRLNWDRFMESGGTRS